MAWHYGTYSCGHEGRVQIYGPIKDRQWKADYHFDRICDDCRRKEIEEENRKAKEESEAMGLKKLVGSPKQIDWATTIRKNFIYDFKETMEKLHKMKDQYADEYAKSKHSLEDIERTFNYLLENKTKAAFWIDNRNKDIDALILTEIKNIPTNQELEEQKLEEELRKESAVFPDDRKTDAIVNIIVSTDNVSAKFEKNKNFINVVKSLGYKWNGSVWKKDISETTGTAEERAAELGNRLLNEGFPISILDEEIREKAINGNFEPECTRWIYRIKGKNKLIIKWKGYNDDLYRKARSLPGAKWSNGMVVDVAHYLEVEDFAELYGFEFTKAAKKLIGEHKREMEQVEIVQPREIENEEKEGGLEDILESSDAILDDLKD